jgi:hypothetical protein
VLPEVLDALRDVRAETHRNIAELVELMERLGDSLEPLGRLADRVPGVRR